MAGIRIALPILLSFVAALPALGQSGDTIKIHLTFDVFSVRTSPDPASGNSHGDYILTLSGKNEIGVTATSSTASSSRSASATTAFGNIQSSGDQTTAWHVAGPHKIIGITDGPQNQQIGTITVTDKTCSYNLVAHLKPGFQEYKLFSTNLNAWAYYSQVRYSNFTCTIQ